MWLDIEAKILRLAFSTVYNTLFLLDFLITYVRTEATYNSQTSNYWRFVILNHQAIFKSPAKGLHRRTKADHS